MRALVSRVFLLSVLQCAMAAGQANTPSATVEIQYCGVHPGKPPLKYLTFNVTMHNLAARTQWFLWPRSLYEQTPGPMKENGVNGAEIFAAPERKVMAAQERRRLSGAAVASRRDGYGARFQHSFLGRQFFPTAPPGCDRRSRADRQCSGGPLGRSEYAQRAIGGPKLTP